MTKGNKISSIFKKALFPTITTIISFLMFIIVYLFDILTSIEPYYLKGLLFAVPFVCFGIITFFTVIEQMKRVASAIFTAILIIVLGFASVFEFAFMALDKATTVTKDVGKYERVLKITGYPNNQLTKYFPDKIPSNAENIVFSYNPAFLQGGENFTLKLNMDSDSILYYTDQFSQKAKWVGKSNDSTAEENGVFLGIFNNSGYTDLPEDFIIYLFFSKQYQMNNWNHGELSIAAISNQRNEIIFLAEDW